MLLDENHPAWRPLLVHGWSDRVRQLCGAAGVALMGNLSMRCVRIWREWPWEAAKIVHPDVSGRAKRRVADQICAVRQCCTAKTDGLTTQLRDRVDTPEELLGMQMQELLYDVFAETVGGHSSQESL